MVRSPVRAWTQVLAAVLLGAAATASCASGEFEWHLPPGFPRPAVPADNPMSAAKVALGALLFADPRLSITGTYSCQSCHSPSRAFTDGRAVSRGALGDVVPLNAPTLLNAAYNASLGWKDPAVLTLEQQMRGPLFNEHPPELGLHGHENEIAAVLSADERVAGDFAAAFPGEPHPVSMDNVIRAIAAFERTLFAGASPFDRYLFGGEHGALDQPQKRGMQLFFSQRAGCSACHSGINFTGPWVDAGQPAATPVFADTGTGQKVRVPTLRNLASTAPFMHDGRFATLDAVLDHYERLATASDADPRLRRAPLTTGERADLRSFLDALNDAR
jgi:cytochrome c peroxidase